MRKIKGKLISLALVCVTLMSLALSSNAAAPSGLLVIGDSIASGYGLSGYSGARPGEAVDSFGSRLAAEYGLTYGHTYYDFAVDGMTSAELAAALNGGKGWSLHKDDATYTTEYQYSQYAVADSSAMEAALKGCDTIVISIGGNDLLSPFLSIITEYVEANAALLKTLGIDIASIAGGDTAGIPSMLSGAGSGATSSAMMSALTALLTSEDAVARFTAGAADFAANLASITSAIYAVNPDADVYLLCLYNPFDGIEMFAPLAELTEGFISSMSLAAAAHAETLKASGYSFTAVTVKDAFKGNAMIMTNMLAYDIHPNALGHATLFEALRTAINAGGNAVQPSYSPSTSDAGLLLAGLAAVGSLLTAGLVRRSRKLSAH